LDFFLCKRYSQDCHRSARSSVAYLESEDTHPCDQSSEATSQLENHSITGTEIFSAETTDAVAPPELLEDDKYKIVYGYKVRRFKATVFPELTEAEVPKMEGEFMSDNECLSSVTTSETEPKNVVSGDAEVPVDDVELRRDDTLQSDSSVECETSVLDTSIQPVVETVAEHLTSVVSTVVELVEALIQPVEIVSEPEPLQILPEDEPLSAETFQSDLDVTTFEGVFETAAEFQHSDADETTCEEDEDDLFETVEAESKQCQLDVIVCEDGLDLSYLDKTGDDSVFEKTRQIESDEESDLVTIPADDRSLACLNGRKSTYKLPLLAQRIATEQPEPLLAFIPTYRPSALVEFYQDKELRDFPKFTYFEVPKYSSLSDLSNYYLDTPEADEKRYTFYALSNYYDDKQSLADAKAIVSQKIARWKSLSDLPVEPLSYLLQFKSAPCLVGLIERIKRVNEFIRLVQSRPDRTSHWILTEHPDWPFFHAHVARERLKDARDIVSNMFQCKAIDIVSNRYDRKILEESTSAERLEEWVAYADDYGDDDVFTALELATFWL